MAKVPDEYINEIADIVTKSCNLKNGRHSLSTLDSIGQNYFGVIVPVAITGHNDKGIDITVNIILKLAPVDEKYRVSGAVTKFFIREIFVYTKVLSKYAEIQHKFPIDSQLMMPAVYHTNTEYGKEVIVLEDLSASSGFRPYNIQRFLDHKHLTLAVKELGKLHALSFILKNNDAALFEEIVAECVPLNETNNKRFMDILKDRLEKAVSKFEGTKYQGILDNLNKNCSLVFDKTLDMANEKCIIHGDVWKENILFKYQNTDPVSACLIDYQTTRISSPAYDILYLLISSTECHSRRYQYKCYMDLYYQTLTETLKHGGLESKTIYPLQKFQQDLKTVAPAVLITANTAFWLSSGLQEDGHVRSKHVLLSPDERDKAVQDYKGIIKGIIDDYYRYGYMPMKMLQ